MAPLVATLLAGFAAVAASSAPEAAAATCHDAAPEEDDVAMLQIATRKPEKPSCSKHADCPRSSCPPKGFDTQGALEGGFDLEWFIAEKWYVQQQMVVQYLPADYFFCVTAQYTKLEKPTMFGYDISVDNAAQNSAGEALNEGNVQLGAKIVDAKEGKLTVAPLFLPSLFGGPYWIVAWNMHDEWALISGGPPKVEGEDGTCKTGSGTNGSGLWIFSRQRQPPHEHVAAARAVAEAKGFDLSVLKVVDQSDCNDPC